MDYEEKVYKKGLEIWDNHCHVCFPQPIEETLHGFEQSIDELGLSGLGLLAAPIVDHTRVPVDYLENMKMLYLKDRLQIPVYAYAAFAEYHEDGDKQLEFAKRMMDMGFDGFKSLEMHPKNRKKLGKGLCDMSFDAFFSYIEENQIPMICHVGDPRFNWDMGTASDSAIQLGRVYGDGFSTLDELYAEMEEVFKKHPNVKIALAHFYFKSDDYEGLVRLMETYPNLYLDMTPGTEMFVGFSKDIARWREFFVKYEKRLLLGSDLYGVGLGKNRHKQVRCFLEETEEFAINEEGEMVTPIHLPDDILTDIYSQNAVRMMGHAPKTINYKMAYEFCKEIADNHLEELNDIGKQNLQVITEYWKAMG